MCGIAGVLRSDGRPVDPDDLRPMVAALHHRGPDDNAVYCKGRVGLAHTRLAIVDIENGGQPLFSGKDLALVCNGEIYNALYLRKRSRDFAFATETDCEPILELYERHGMEATRHLRGMYAFALSDSSRDEVVLARDPVGIKPLYYAPTKTGTVFASTISALLSTGAIERTIDANAAQQFLQCQYSFGAATPMSTVKRLLPGEVIRFRKGHIVERRRDHALRPIRPQNWTEAESLSRFDAAIRNSVEAHLQADVPLGLFLSGGIDSSILLSVLAQSGRASLTTFTCGFEGQFAADEREAARSLSNAVGATHHAVEVTDADFINLLPRVAAALDDPTADYAALATYKLGQEASKHVKAVLCGEGGDELFAGYGRYRVATQWWRFYRRGKLRAGIMDDLGVLRTDSVDWAGQLDGETPFHSEYACRLRRMQAEEFSGWVPNDLMIKLDRCLMAHGVEGRVPFLDPIVIDTALQMPDAHKIHGRMGKWILRRWLQLNSNAAQAFARKQGFTPPIAHWLDLCGRRLAPLVAAQPVIREFCRTDAVESLFGSGGKAAVKAAYLLLFFALWYKVHIERCSPEGSIFDVLSVRS